jgi:HD-GYP domain-containing protein (c-di-GMP phosphodiesterase class II)
LAKRSDQKTSDIMNNRASAYAVVIIAVALAFLVSSLPDLISVLRDSPRGVGIWFLLLVVAGVLTNMAVKGGGAVTGTAVVAFAIVITFGGAAAAWLGAIAILVLSRVVLRLPTLRSLVDMSQMSVSLALAGLIYNVSGGVRLGLSDWSLGLSLYRVMPFVLCHLACFFTTTWLESIRSSLKLRRSTLKTWRAGYLWMLPQSFAVPLVGVAMAYVYLRLSILLVAIFFLWLIYYARSSRINLELENSQRGTVAALATAVDSSTPFLGGESERVAGLAVELGKRIGLSGWRMQALEYAGLLHDIGYLAIGKRVLGKEECLSAEEWASVRRHAEVGATIIGRAKALKRISEIVRAHHERPDGRGYPRGLKNGDIPKEASILKVSDAFVAMTADRPYRERLSVDEAVERISAGAGTQFDAEVVQGIVELKKYAALDRYVSGEFAEAA